MKIFIKKLLLSLIILVMVFNFVVSAPVQASSEKIAICGIADVLQSILAVVGSIADGIIGILTYIPKLFAMIGEVAVMGIMSAIAGCFGYVNPDGTITSTGTGLLDVGFLTPDDIFFNKLLLTDINIFKLDLGSNPPDAIIQLRTNVALWYFIMRLIAISVLLAVLIYIAIRMAIATVAQDKAFYKRMLVNWASSIALVFVLHYLIIIILNINSSLVSIFRDIYDNNSGTGGLQDAVGNLLLRTLSISATTGWASIAVVGMLIIQSFAFLIYYIKRMLTIAFLIIISPLITLTYSIDKLGDGKAQALNTWLKEFFFTIIIQPFHCVTYMVVMSLALSALKITGNFGADFVTSIFSGGVSSLIGGLLAILCIKFVWDGEKMVKNIFGIKVSDSLGDAVKNAAIAGTIVKRSVDGASKVSAKGVKKLTGSKGFKDKFSADNIMAKADKKINKQNEILNDPNKGKLAKKIAGSKKKTNERIRDIADKRKKTKKAYENGEGGQKYGTKFGQKIHNSVKKAKEFGEEHPKLKRFIEKSSSPAVAAAILAGAMTYGAESGTSMFDAAFLGIGAGKAIGNKWDKLRNRKNDNYVDNTKDNMKMFEEQIMNRKVDENDPEQLSQFAQDSQRMGKEGDYDKMSKEKTKAEENVEQLLREQGFDENDIQRIIEQIMNKLQNGIFSKNLNMDQIADDYNLDVENLRKAVKDFASLKIHQSTYSDNESINEIYGDNEYYKVIFEALALQSGRNQEEPENPPTNPSHSGDDDESNTGNGEKPHYADIEWDKVPEEEKGKEFEKMLGEYSKEKGDGSAKLDAELEKIIALLEGLNLHTSDERADHLQKLFKNPNILNPIGTEKFNDGITVPEADVVSTIDNLHKTNEKITKKEIVEEIKKEKHIEETEVHKLEEFVQKVYERELFKTVDGEMKDKRKA